MIIILVYVYTHRGVYLFQRNKFRCADHESESAHFAAIVIASLDLEGAFAFKGRTN